LNALAMRSPGLVILAAGASSRLGRCKALLPLPSPAGDERTPIELLASAGAAFDGAAPLVVTGADHAAIEASGAARRAGAEVACNANWHRGRTGGLLLAASLRAGLDLCVAPVDVPLVPRAIFDALLEAWLRAGSPERGWLAPLFRSSPSAVPRFGHPIVLGRSLLRDLAEEDPSIPLRALRTRAKPVFSVEVVSPEVLDDLDTAEDLGRLRGERPT
jgi:CTP:molybdopterin cytidylyltransferase MocA